MGFGLNVKVEAPKVEVPKVDVAAATSSVTDAISGAVDSAKGAVNDAVSTATAAVNGAVSAATEAANSVVSVATKAVASLTTVAGAIADVAASFTGAIEDIALEPHLSLDANASFGKTQFEKGPIWIRIEMPAGEAKDARETLHLFTGSGSYDKKKLMKDYIESTPDTVDVLFEDAPMDENYSLEIVLKGKKRTLFKDIPYGDLRKMRMRY